MEPRQPTRPQAIRAQPLQPPVRLSRAQVREVDRRAIEEYHIPGVLLMENAARAVVDVVCNNVGKKQDGRDVLILCGGGNNGGDGLAVARHLHNRGHSVRIGLFTDPRKYAGEALVNWNICQAMQLPSRPLTFDDVVEFGDGVVVDALFGTGLTQPPRGPFKEIVDSLLSTGAEVVAVDVPSGLDCDTGEPLGACVRAAHTVTFVAEKLGFANPIARQYLGHVTVGDIGCPRELIERIAARPA
jgi:hydroxyethylthiazole kinase-like uncharacterized protein yjeF